ncbi:MAG TPA: polyprenol monophosphomannose synthase [Dermatophilaceae bacterium]|nr:polyprenol monophosphomannose synthase [Dermatophilaceae bacterium]
MPPEPDNTHNAPDRTRAQSSVPGQSGPDGSGPDQWPRLCRVLVLMPTYNERDNLPDLVRRVRAATPEVDILVLDDNSPDGTGAVADELAAHDARVWALHRAGKEGLGKAYLDGFRWGLDRGYDALVEMDADGSHRPEHLPQLLAAARNADVVIGSRWVPGGEVINWPAHRKALSLGGNLYIRVLLGVTVRDATAGYRVYRASALRSLDLAAVQSHGYCFQVDLTWKAVRAGLRVVEVPISFVERQVGDSKMSGSIIAESMLNVTGWGVRHRLDMVRSRWRDRTHWHRLDG